MSNKSFSDMTEHEQDIYMFYTQGDANATAAYVQKAWAKHFMEGSNGKGHPIERCYKVDTTYPPCTHDPFPGHFAGCFCYRRDYPMDRRFATEGDFPVLRGIVMGEWEENGVPYDTTILPPPNDPECMDEKSFENEWTYGFHTHFVADEAKSGPEYKRYLEALRRLQEHSGHCDEEEEEWVNMPNGNY
jgi:hypothetical protein